MFLFGVCSLFHFKERLIRQNPKGKGLEDYGVFSLETIGHARPG